MRFHDHGLAGAECFLQNVQDGARVDFATHVHVDRGIACGRRAVESDMASGQHRKPRHAGFVRVAMQVNSEQGGASNFDATLECTLDVLEVVQPAGIDQVDDQMIAGKANAIALNVLSSILVRSRHRGRLARYTRGFTMIFLLGGA